jgi:poly(ADP-ribose) glycohydrolase
MPISEIFIGGGENGQLGKVDDSPVKIHVDFANEYLGGGLFSNIMSQEEILFLVRPECLVSLLFCHRLGTTESVCIFGAEKFSQYTGFASNVRFVGDYNDETPLGYSRDNTEVMLQHVLVCIDASKKTSGIAQYIDDFDREINKAYCGFSAVPLLGESVATGNWGSGSFGGNMSLKFIQQVLAASQAGRSIVYYPFVRDFEDKLIPFAEWLQNNNLTVGKLYTMYKDLMKKCYKGPNSRLSDLDIFESLMDM